MGGVRYGGSVRYGGGGAAGRRGGGAAGRRGGGKIVHLFLAVTRPHVLESFSLQLWYP